MPIIKLLVKPDNLFLTHVLYEGILVVLQHNRDYVEITPDRIELPRNALRRAFEDIAMDEKLSKHYRSVSIGLAGNDIKHDLGGKLLGDLGIMTSEKITGIGQIINAILDNPEHIQDIGDAVLTYTIKRDFIVGRSGDKLLSGLQIFKVDRYTGLTSLDAGTTYQHYTVRFDPILLFLSILGLASSYSGGTRNLSYHLFLSPDEILEILIRNDQEYLYNVMSVKRQVVEKLREILRTRLPEEAIILRTLIDLSIQDMLARYEIEYLSLQLYVIAREGNTFKIYNKIPLTLYAHPYYIEVLRNITSDPEKLLEAIQEALEPKSPLITALQSLDTINKSPDASHALNAVRELYRFISSGSLDALYAFLRELEMAGKVLEQDGSPKSIRLAEKYKYILSRISSSI